LIRLATALLLLAVEFIALFAAVRAVLSHMCLDVCPRHPSPVSMAVPVVEVMGYFVIPGLVICWGMWRRRPEIALPGALLICLVGPALVLLGV
jgi:hypothetical protein